MTTGPMASFQVCFQALPNALGQTLSLLTALRS